MNDITITSKLLRLGYFANFDIFNNKDLQNEINEIYIYTDSAYELPNNLDKFIKLKKLTLEGTRGWNLKCTNIIDTIKYINMAKVGNLGSGFFFGFEKFLNLTHLDINEEYLENSDYTFPNLKKLRIINVHCGVWPPNFNPKNILLHPFFKYINSNIIKSYRNGKEIMSPITIKLNVK